MNFLKYALLFFAISFPLMIWAPDTASRRHSAAEPVRRDSDTILSWTAVVLAHQQGAYPNVVAVSDALSIVGQVSIASMATDYGVDLRVLPDAKSIIGVRRQVSSGSTFEQIVLVDPILQSISTIHDYSNPPIAHLSKGRMTAAIGVDYPSSIGFGAVVDSSGALTYSFDYATPLSSGASTVVTGPAPYDGWILKIAGRPNYVFMTTRHRVYRVDALNGTLIEVTSTQLSPGSYDQKLGFGP